MTVKDDIIPCASWVAHSYDAIEHPSKRLLFQNHFWMSWNYFTLSYSTYYGSQKRYKQVALSVMDSQYNQFTSSSTQISSNFRSDFFQLPISIIWCVFCLLLGSGYYGLMACLVLLTRVSSLRTLDLPSRSDMLWPKQIWRLPQSWWRSPKSWSSNICRKDNRRIMFHISRESAK